jgi:aldose 1-epimerase
MHDNAFTITEDAYEDGLGRVVRVMVLRNTGTGELAEILLNTPGGQNRSNGSGSVNGLLLQDQGSGKLREVLSHRRGVAGGLMAPFANRVRDGTYTFAGEQHHLVCNWDEMETRLTRSGQHAIHGLLPQELHVASRGTTDSSASLTLTASFDGTDEGYPFPVDVAFTYRLNASGFTIAVAATNASVTGQAAPFMVGWHPYIQLRGPVDGAVLSFDSRSSYNMSEPTGTGPDGPERDSHPTGVSRPSTDFTEGQPLGDRYWDDGFKATASTRAVPRLETRVMDSAAGSNDSAVVLWQDPQCRFIQVYTGLRDRGVIAVEPMSGQTDCFNNGDGLVVLQAGETWETAFGVRLHPPTDRASLPGRNVLE